MAQGYHHRDPGAGDAEPPPDAMGAAPLALRRHTDRCFFAVEEVVEEADGSVRGYIVEGVLVDKDDVAELRPGEPGCDPTDAPPAHPR